MRTIRFNSVASNWRKEYLGLKPNTIRYFGDEKDIRKEILDLWIFNKSHILKIQIQNTSTNEIFIRTVKDVTLYNGQYIISWFE